MRKYFALVLAALMCLTAFTGCSGEGAADHSAEIAQLQQEISDLRNQLQAMQERLVLLETGSVADWALDGRPLTQGSGAEITLTVTPTAYREGQMALLRVLLEDRSIAELYCDWDGTAYTARVELDAADGYSYHLILSTPEGSVEHLELNSPEKPVKPQLVYLYSSLSALCMLNVYEWHIADEALTLDAGTAEVQLPTLTATGEAASCTGADLVLMLEGRELERRELNVPQAEEEGIFMHIDGISFSMPELEEGSQLELWLEVTLSDGQVLTHIGSSWYLFEGELIQAVG